MINYNMVHVVSLWFLSSLNHRRRKKFSLGGRTILTATVYAPKLKFTIVFLALSMLNNLLDILPNRNYVNFTHLNLIMLNRKNIYHDHYQKILF